MKKICLPFLAALALCACRQQEPEIASTTTIATPDTVTQDSTPQQTAATAEAPVPTCELEGPALPPPDTATTDTSLLTYLQELEKAVQTQDAKQLQKLTDPNTRTGFGENNGWRSFARQWQPEDAHSEVWLLLEHLLRLGGGYPLEGNDKLYALPYVYSNWPDSIDAFMHVAVIKPGAILREEPVANAAALCALSEVILKVDYGKSYPEGAPQKEWWHVQSADGELQGYLHRADVHSPVGYRAIFNKNKQGSWQMTALVNGD